MTEHEFMLTSILDCDRTDLYARPVSLTLGQEHQLREMQRRRQEGEPLQYILGSSEFFGLSLTVDPRVLIPRPETEILVEKILERAKGLRPRSFEILDIGTGSGNIAISLAKHIEDSFITAIDISPDAVCLAKQNAERHGVENKIEFIRKDMREFFLSGGQLFDMIVSNPPYILSSHMNRLPCDVRKEPRIALDGGPDGMDYYRLIISQGVRHLKQGGFLVLEIGDGQRKGIEALFAQDAPHLKVEFIKDYRNTDRIVVAQ